MIKGSVAHLPVSGSVRWIVMLLMQLERNFSYIGRNFMNEVKKRCVDCLWRCYEDITCGYVCVNDQSAHCADWVEEEDYCPHFERK